MNNVECLPAVCRDGERLKGVPRRRPPPLQRGSTRASRSTRSSRTASWNAMGLDPATTLHDVRWGEAYEGSFVWVFEISGSVPVLHNGGSRSTRTALRQPPTRPPPRGVSKPGEIVWSRVFHRPRPPAHRPRPWLGARGAAKYTQPATRAPPAPGVAHSTEALHGVSRDELMARHKANHVQASDALNATAAHQTLRAKAALFAELGLEGAPFAGARCQRVDRRTRRGRSAPPRARVGSDPCRARRPASPRRLPRRRVYRRHLDSRVSSSSDRAAEP